MVESIIIDEGVMSDVRGARLIEVFRTANGRVFQCECLHHFHVQFGPVVLALDHDGVIELYDRVCSVKPAVESRCYVGTRWFQLCTGDQRIGLALTAMDIQELRRLLSGAMARGGVGLSFARSHPARPIAEA